MVNFMDFKSIQGPYSCTTKASQIKLDVYQRLIVSYLVMANFIDLNQFKGSCITKAS